VKALDCDKVRSDLCLVLDADGEPGGIVIGAPTHDTFTATFHGVAAHAGVAPEAGKSALLMASRAILAMPGGRIDEETTANVGTIEGGSATNVIPARVTITGECRSLESGRVDAVGASMETAMRDAAAEYGGTVDVAWTREYDAFRMPEDSPELALVRDACADSGLAPRFFTTGGGSDGNVFAAAGIPTLVLSCGMRAMHSIDEEISVADLESLAALVAAVIVRAGTWSR
jgi:tripeptide aminopeptidase